MHCTWAEIGVAARRLSAAAVIALSVGGCIFTTEYLHGYQFDEAALDQIPVGASQDQVLLVLGTPSTVATVGGEAFYYISQKSQKTAFMKQQVVDQRVLAVYFDEGRRVTRIANYGMQDGKVFDFISRSTPAGGQELSMLTQLLKGLQLNPFRS